MRFRIVGAASFGVLLLLSAGCGSSRSYPANKADDQYDLAAMSLTADDIPAGFAEADLPDHEFDNEGWAGILGADDPQAKQTQLDAQGRIKAYVSAFQAEKLGKVLSITAISTLYKDVASAKDAEAKYACGIPIDDKTPLDSYKVPPMGDSSTGFMAESTQGNGNSFTDTNFCFRTGRIVHVVQQTSIPGVEDVALNVRLARLMLQHVNDAFDGKKAPAAESTPAGGKLVPLTPGATSTAAPKATPGR